MTKMILHGCVLLAALYVSIASGANVVSVTGEVQNKIQLNDSETLEVVQAISVEELLLGSISVVLWWLLSLEKYVFVIASVDLRPSILQFEVMNSTNTLEYVKVEKYDEICGEIVPSSLSATYDYINDPRLVVACLETTFLVDPETLAVDGIFPTPKIPGLRVNFIVDAEATANYLYTTVATKPQSDDDKSEGAVVQISRVDSSVVNWASVRGQLSHLKIAGSSELFLTSSGNGDSYISQLNPKTLEEIDRLTPQGFEFLQMTMSPDLRSLFMYIQKTDRTAGRVRSFDQSVYPAAKACPDVRIEMSPGGQPIVVTEEYLFVRSNASMTRFTLSSKPNNLGCPLQKTEISYPLDATIDTQVVAIACLECLSIS
mmetsp:Transcript_22349/g.32257  ORF Transcript_22349/g.32257 Transcript_22349/m.32257 type:complete len:373 (-) Transcript_22349:159-1277(-)